mmetsp:Transcript_18260/g.55060  ORF Transcript_18260/g.55060 Transcript_18260/m.55060 type:complete len:818 (-) Transcript_18260:1605-4058(-)
MALHTRGGACMPAQGGRGRRGGGGGGRSASLWPSLARSHESTNSCCDALHPPLGTAGGNRPSLATMRSAHAPICPDAAFGHRTPSLRLLQTRRFTRIFFRMRSVLHFRCHTQLTPPPSAVHPPACKVVYLTDGASRQLITSWRLDGLGATATRDAKPAGVHAVVVVDSSGSMRKGDVNGYATRKQAVYDCLVRQFVQDQIAGGGAADIEVSVIEMSDWASTVISRSKMDRALQCEFKRLGKQRARNHGNYLPALDKALDLLHSDAHMRHTLMLLFFSDGEPSDHTFRECDHGIEVWRQGSRTHLRECPFASAPWVCRQAVKRAVQEECVRKVHEIGDVLGYDRVVMSTIAFGNIDQDYSVLQKMGEALPRGSFHKLGLDAHGLSSALSTLSSSLTTLVTNTGLQDKTLRSKVVVKEQVSATASQMISSTQGWRIYHGEWTTRATDGNVAVYRYDMSKGALVQHSLPSRTTGIAFYAHPFANGVERYVYRCAQICVLPDCADRWYCHGQSTAIRMQRRMVCKEAKYVENLGRNFQEIHARVQAEAEEMARMFRQQMQQNVPGGASSQFHLRFLQTDVYWCSDSSYPDGEARVIVEDELDGHFRKWNSNNGRVCHDSTAGTSVASVEQNAGRATSSLPTICEDEYEPEEEMSSSPATFKPVLDEVPQAFSHFSYVHSRGTSLVCDLQGVWNATDGFVLTDPVIHHALDERRRNDPTDKGSEGIHLFFRSHQCGTLCEKLLLPTPEMSELKEAARRSLRACLVCMRKPRATRFAPCGHASCCSGCARRIVVEYGQCPICRTVVTSVSKKGSHIARESTYV